jgi:molybdenum cofactor synthesis domain-containing protein
MSSSATSTPPLPPYMLNKLQAGAFQSLCAHLRDRPQVSNMALMTTSGFCRNCLAKWMVLEAQRSMQNDDSELALTNFNYEQAAEVVYGMPVSEWKQRHQSKASDEELQAYKASQDLWAKHEIDVVLEKPVTQTKSTTATTSLASNVCCEAPTFEPSLQQSAMEPAPTLRMKLPLLQQQQQQQSIVSIAIVTVSDRACNNDYATGDLSGPAAEQIVRELLPKNCVVTRTIVPDDLEEIQSALLHLSRTHSIILTTGGTGWSARDVTPEATRAILTHECMQLMNYCLLLQSNTKFAALSRGTAGLIEKSVVANLPGHPEAVRELVPLVLPLLLHAIVETSTTTNVGEGE